MKILLVNEGSVERAGVCLFMLQWAGALRRVLPDSDVTAYFRVGVRDSAVARAFEEQKIRVITGNIAESMTSADRANRQKLRADLRAAMIGGCDVVHVQSSVLGFTSIVLAEAMRAGVPVRVAHVHGKFDESGLKRAAHHLLRWFIRRKATAYAYCSEVARTYMFGCGKAVKAKWCRVPNAIQTRRFACDAQARRRYRERVGIAEGEKLLGAVGYLEEVKNHAFLLEVMAEIKRRGLPAKLAILGEGSLRDQLARRIVALGLEDRVLLAGVTDDVPGWLSAMDVYLMPSLSEGFPISAVEAQASGLPCLMSDRITTEVDITAAACHLPIDAGPAVWADAIEKQTPADAEARTEAAEAVARAGYDVAAMDEVVRRLYPGSAKG